MATGTLSSGPLSSTVNLKIEHGFAHADPCSICPRIRAHTISLFPEQPQFRLCNINDLNYVCADLILVTPSEHDYQYQSHGDCDLEPHR
jgi:hypothetical protein